MAAAVAASAAAMPAAPADAERVDPLRLLAFLAMCFGMFMAFLDIQVVSASLSEIQAGLAGVERRNHLGADLLSDGRSGRDPAVGLSVARARHPRHVRDRRRRLHRRRA